MLAARIAVVPSDPDVGVNPNDVTRVAAALQKQVLRDFGPIWGIEASVDAFLQLEQVPRGCWPILLAKDVPSGGGVHNDENFFHIDVDYDSKHEDVVKAQQATIDQQSEALKAKAAPTDPSSGDGQQAIVPSE